MKSRIIRISQLIAFIVLAGYFILFVTSALPSFGSGSFGASQDELSILFGVLVVFILICFYVYFVLFTPEEKRRFMLERSGAMKDGQVIQKTAETFDMMPGERVLFTATPCFVHDGNAFGFNETTRDVTVTDKRIRLVLKSFGSVTENFWRNDIDGIPDSKSLWERYYPIEKISYEEETKGDKAIGFLKINYLGKQLIRTEAEMKIYHPRAKEICDSFSKPAK